MRIEEILDIIRQQFVQGVVAAVADGPHPHVQVEPARLLELCTFIKDEPRLAFDLLRCISAIDWPQQQQIELSYDLLSIRCNHAFALKIRLERAAPEVDSVSSVWPAAEWHEREAFDLMGVVFRHHPDLRRILMPEDWSGHPLRKDYQDPTDYHGLRLKP